MKALRKETGLPQLSCICLRSGKPEEEGNKLPYKLPVGRFYWSTCFRYQLQLLYASFGKDGMT
jgi:hypothetical protein